MNTTRVLTILLIIPLIGFGVSKWIEVDYESEFMLAISQQDWFDQDKAHLYSLKNVCSHPEGKKELPACFMFNSMLLMQKASIFAGVLPLLMIFMISVGGRISRNNREVLLKIFTPGLHLTIYALVLLIIVNAVLLMASLYLGESMLLGMVHLYLIGAIGIGALIGASSMIKSSLNALKKAESTVIGKNIRESDSPGLFRFVKDIAGKIDALPPDNIIVGLDPNFFVTEAIVNCQAERFSGRTLYISMPLCRILSVNELKSIIGHELAHYKGEDTVYSKKFYPIYRGASDAISYLAYDTQEVSSAWSLIPAIYLLSYFLDAFSIVENKISRERELVADMEGSIITSKEDASSALVKIHAFTGLWDDAGEEVLNALREGSAIANVSILFKELTVKRAAEENFEGLADERLVHPTDSHPPLSIRLESLGVDIASMKQKAQDIDPSDIAIELIDGFESIELELSEYQQKLYRNYLKILSAQFPGDEDVKLPETEEDLAYTVHIDPVHENLKPSDLLATAYYHQREGDDNKYLAYLKHTFKKYPNTEEGGVALKTLMELEEGF